MRTQSTGRPLVAAGIAAIVLTAMFAGRPARAQAPAGGAAQSDLSPREGEAELAATEARLKERYDRLELLAGRLAELSGSTQPRRAALLRQLIAQSRERDVAGQFDRVITALEQESYSTALDGQNALEADLQRLLELMLQEDRDRQIESQRKRIGRYLQDLNRIIRMQRGVKARTDGGDDATELIDDQRQVGDRTGKLGDEIDEQESSVREATAKGGQKESSPGDGKNAPSNDESPSGDQPASGDQRSEAGKPEGQGQSPKADDPQTEEEGAQSSQSPPSPSDAGPSSPSSPAQPNEEPSDPSAPNPGSGSPAGQPQGQPQPPPAEQSTPMQRAAQRLRQAQQRMEQAFQRLEESKRRGAAQQQEQAVEELEQAKAELERILRQLREEELERMLVMLEARFRKMLDAQVEVYEETKRLDAAADKAPAHELEIAGGRLSRKESLIVREADRALVLLREDGTSVAFPEALEQARDDMQSIAERLQDAKFELITQGLEEDVIAALEETLASLQQALKDLRDQKSSSGQPGGGEPGEQPLVDKLAELRMIRALQQRVKDRTERYGAMIDGEQAVKSELLEALDVLALRQQKIFQATRDLSREED